MNPFYNIWLKNHGKNYKENEEAAAYYGYEVLSISVNC